MNADEYLDLLKQKNTILNEIFEYTKSKTFKKDESEIDRIVYYLNNRGKMYDKLFYIENKINTLKKENFNNILHKEVDDIIKKNDIIINNIIILDREKKEIMESILKLLKDNIKSVKSMSKVNNSYLGTYENIVAGSLFDSSK